MTYKDEKISTCSFLRTFPVNVSEEDLIWHRDKKDRIIEIVYGKDWKIQIDNELPLDLKIGDFHFIKAGIYHRLIKGTSELKIIISELDEDSK